MYKSIKYTVPEEIKEKVAKYLSTHNIAKRGEFDGDYERQFNGKVGECVVFSRLYKKMMELKGEGSDGGTDIVYKGLTIDVKTMSRSVYTKIDYSNNYPDLQMKFPTDILVFCSFNRKENVMEICGWIFKCELERKGVLRLKGTDIISGKKGLVYEDDIWEVKNEDLYPFEWLEKYSEEDLLKVKYDRIKYGKREEISN